MLSPYLVTLDTFENCGQSYFLRQFFQLYSDFMSIVAKITQLAYFSKSASTAG